GQIGEPDRARVDAAAIALDAIDEDVHGRRHRHVLRQRWNRHGDDVGPEAELAAPLRAAEANRPHPDRTGGIGIAETQPLHAFGVVDVDPGVQAYEFRLRI